MAQGSLRAKKLQQWAREKEETDEWFPFGRSTSSTRKSGPAHNSSTGSHQLIATPNGSNSYSPAQGDQRGSPARNGQFDQVSPVGFPQSQYFVQSPNDSRFYSMSNLHSQPVQPTANFHVVNGSPQMNLGNPQAVYPSGNLASTPEISSVQPQATYYYPSNVPYPNQSTMGVLQPNVFVSSITNQNHPSQSQPQYVYIQQQPNQPFFPNGQSQQTQLPAIQQSRLQPDVNLNNDGGNKVVYYPYQQQSEPLMVPGGMTYTEQWANQLTTWAQDQRSDGCLSPRTVPTNAPQSNVYMSGPHGPPGYISASQSEAGVPVHRPSHFYPHLMQSVPEANSTSQTSIPKALVAPTGYPQNGLVSQRLAIVSPMSNEGIVAAPPAEPPMRRRLDSVGLPMSSGSIGDESADVNFNSSAQQGLLNASMTASYPGSGFSRSLSMHRRRRTVTGSKDDREIEEEQQKKLEQKLLFDEQIAEKKRQQELEAERERLEAEIAAKDRERIEQRERMESEFELNRWKDLADEERKKESAVRDAWNKAKQEARMLRRAKILHHALEGTDGRSELSRRSSQDDNSSTTTRGLVNDIVGGDRLPLGQEIESNAISPPASLHSSQSPSKQLDRSKSLPPITRGLSGASQAPEDDRPIRPQRLNPLELWEQIAANEPAVEGESTSAMEPSTQEGKSDKESESLIRRRPVVRQSLRKPKSQAAEAANNRRRALSGEREPQNNAEETTVKPTLKSKIPTHQSPSSHSKLSAMKPNLTDLLVPSESTKSSKKVTNGKLYDSKAKPKAHKSSSNNRNFSDEDIGSDISVESDVKRLMERQSKHIRQPSAATYTVSTKPASNSEHNKKAKDAEMVVKQSSILAAGQPVKKPLLNGHDKLAEPVVKPKEKSRKVKKTSAEMLNDLLAIQPVKRTDATIELNRHPNSVPTLIDGAKQDLAVDKPVRLDTLCGNDPLYQPIMTRQKKRGAKPSTLTEKLDIESPSSSEPSPGSKGNINVSPLENADESKTPAGRALLAVKSLRERDLNSTTTIVDANGQVKTPTRLGLPMKVENRNVSTKPESLQMVANGNSASIDGFNTKSPLHETITSRSSAGGSDKQQKILEQLSALRKELKNKQKAVESAFTGAR